MKKMVTVGLIVLALMLGISNLYAQQGPHHQHRGAMWQGTGWCPVMAQTTQDGSTQGTVPWPRAYRGCRMLNQVQSAPQAQSTPQPAESN